MLSIDVPAKEFYDNEKEVFIESKATTIVLEHSLVSISKWESRWQVPFLARTEKTEEQLRHYIKCMTITQNVSPYVYYSLTKKNMQDIRDYIDSPMTATTIKETDDKGGGRNVITSEVIYYYMVALGIPFECQRWHLNRLLTLIRVCNIKNQPKKKLSKRQTLERNRALNEARKKKYNTRG